MRVLVRTTNKICKKTEEKYTPRRVYKALEDRVSKITRGVKSRNLSFITKKISRNFLPYIFWHFLNFNVFFLFHTPFCQSTLLCCFNLQGLSENAVYIGNSLSKHVHVWPTYDAMQIFLCLKVASTISV